VGRRSFFVSLLGGSRLVNLEDKIGTFSLELQFSEIAHSLGNFLPGKSFDALVIDPYSANSPFDIFPFETLAQIFEKFLYLGDDRNIQDIYVQGRKVLSQDSRRMKENTM
jgi:guanine deaminase